MSDRAAEDGKNSLEFRLPGSLKSDVEDLAWENRMTKSELLRVFTRYCVENPEEVLSDTENSDTRIEAD